MSTYKPPAYARGRTMDDAIVQDAIRAAKQWKKQQDIQDKYERHVTPYILISTQSMDLIHYCFDV